MRKIKSKERNNGMKYCTFCKLEKDGERVDAIYRRSWSDELACEEHKYKLEEQEDSHLTEADYQTWMRL